jgi:isoaspartyl peptidase/L-asparaginase-like protein (Ntn-hydrolase superfamily)
MTTRRQGNKDTAEKSRDPDLSGAEAALRRAVESSRRRAMETIGAVAVLKDGRVVWEKADGTSVNEPEQVARND